MSSRVAVVSREHSERPGLLQAGVFFYVGASYAYPGVLRAYRQGRSDAGLMCAGGGVNGGLAARGAEVRGR